MTRDITKKNLVDYIKKLDEAIDYEVTLICFGGTALNIIDPDHITEDIDISYITDNGSEFRDTAEEVAERMGIGRRKMHLFNKEETRTLTRIFDYSAGAKDYKELGLKNIKFKLMNIYDIILTKIRRFEGRDLEDLKKIVTKLDISKSILERRFGHLYAYQEDKENFKKRYNDFSELFGGSLKE